MTTEPAPHPLLLIDGAGVPGADGAILPLDAEAAGEGTVVRRWRPEQGADAVPMNATICVVDGDPDAATEIRRDGLTVIPRVAVRRGRPRFEFARAKPGEGFSTYRLDPGSFAEDLAADSGARLADWLDRAVALGFGAVWLHALDAAQARRGFAIELLRRAHRKAPSLAVWLSGGGCELRHYQRLAGEPGLAAVVTEAEDLPPEGVANAVAALTPPTRGDATPVACLSALALICAALLPADRATAQVSDPPTISAAELVTMRDAGGLTIVDLRPAPKRLIRGAAGREDAAPPDPCVAALVADAETRNAALAASADRLMEAGCTVYRLGGEIDQWVAAGLFAPAERWRPDTVPFVIPRGLCEQEEPVQSFEGSAGAR